MVKLQQGYLCTAFIGPPSGTQIQYNKMDTSEEGSQLESAVEMTSDDIIHTRSRDMRDDFLEISETPQV